MTYTEKIKSPKWQRMRLKTMERDRWACVACGDDERTLNVHHKRYRGANPWDAEMDDLETLCEACHESRHFPGDAHLSMGTMTAAELRDLLALSFAEEDAADSGRAIAYHRAKQSQAWLELFGRDER